jgi:hypothetical protein
VCAILLAAVLASWLFPKRAAQAAPPAVADQTESATRVDFGSSARTNAPTDSSS